MDYGSRSSLAKAVEQAQRADTLVYAILYFDPRGYICARSDRSGLPIPMARARPPDVAAALGRDRRPVYDRIQDELRNQYSLGYTPDRPGAGGGYRRIRLTVRNRGLTVLTRDGYYPE